MSLPDFLINEFEELVSKYPERRSGLIPALHRCQEELGGWITPEIMEDLGEFFGLEPIEIYGVKCGEAQLEVVDTDFPNQVCTPPADKFVLGVLRCDIETGGNAGGGFAGNTTNRVRLVR